VIAACSEALHRTATNFPRASGSLRLPWRRGAGASAVMAAAHGLMQEGRHGPACVGMQGRQPPCRRGMQRERLRRSLAKTTCSTVLRSSLRGTRGKERSDEGRVTCYGLRDCISSQNTASPAYFPALSGSLHTLRVINCAVVRQPNAQAIPPTDRTNRGCLRRSVPSVELLPPPAASASGAIPKTVSIRDHCVCRAVFPTVGPMVLVRRIPPALLLPLTPMLPRRFGKSRRICFRVCPSAQPLVISFPTASYASHARLARGSC
jgi:hypothetical protein